MDSATDSNQPGRFGGSDIPRDALDRDARHIASFMQVLQNRDSSQLQAAARAEDFYLVRADKQSLWELIGIRVRGYPSAMLVAVEVQQHPGTTAHGRPMLGQLLNKPPRQTAVQGVGPPPGLVRVTMPQTTESIPEFIGRMRAVPSSGSVLHVDADLVDFAFDFRFGNPSGLDHMRPPSTATRASAFRTADGYVITATAHGLYYTLHRETHFVTVTDVVQHRRNCSHRLPTLCINRKYIVAEAEVGAEGAEKTLSTLAFDPAIATDAHLFGAACEKALG